MPQFKNYNLLDLTRELLYDARIRNVKKYLGRLPRYVRRELLENFPEMTKALEQCPYRN